MELLRIVLIVLLATVGGGVLLGILWGKHAVKKATSDAKPLLSARERIIYAAMLVAGATCILVGVFLVPSFGRDSEDFVDPDGGFVDAGMMGMEGMDEFNDGEEFYDDSQDNLDLGDTEADDSDTELDADSEFIDGDDEAGDADNTTADQEGANVEEAVSTPAASGSTGSTGGASGGTRIVGGTGGTVVVVEQAS